MKYYLRICILIVISLTLVNCQHKNGSTLSRNLNQYIENDIKTIQLSHKGFEKIIKFTKPYTTISAIDLTRDDKIAVFEGWKNFLDYIVVLDNLYQTYETYKSFNYPKSIRSQLNQIQYAAFLTQYRYAMEYIFLMDKNKIFHEILNEEIPEFNLPKNMYSNIKFRFLNVIIAANFIKLNTLNSYSKSNIPQLHSIMQADIQYIWDTAKLKGPLETAKNGIQITHDSLKKFFLPIKRNTLIIGKIKVNRFGSYLIGENQKNEIKNLIKPGDIFLTRREWHISNLGIPGFWSHVSLYIGTPKQRELIFNSNNKITSWVKSKGELSGNFESLLKKDFPDMYKKSISNDKNPFTFIESYDPGVSLTQLSFSANADSLGILRPNTNPLTKAIAIYKAFYYLGRPYDFDFNFLTDTTLVCTELVSKAYEKTNKSQGLKLPIKLVLGKPVVVPNDIVKMFNDEMNSKSPQFSFIAFYDGDERLNTAQKSNVTLFKESWKRPKWHIIVKGTKFE
tara:strand:- start:4353 stop:5873 length:1521 start_codon:yes stop_codon:yes gene_type:complete